MQKIINGFKSRTAWSGIALFAVNTIPMIENIVPTQWKALVNAILGLLIFYFRVTPRS